jgi:hypothetical protein
VLISGGIGITPLQSVYNHLIHQSAAGRKFRKVGHLLPRVFLSLFSFLIASLSPLSSFYHCLSHTPQVVFVWSVQDRAMVDALYTEKLHSDVETHNQNIPYLPISFQPQMSPPPSSRVNDTDLVVNPMNNRSDKATHPQDMNSSFIFHNEYYLTRIRATDQQHTAGIHPGVQSWLKFGRPNLKEIFANVSSLCKTEHISRVAVCVCGPTPMVNDVSDLCRASKMDPHCDAVRFDCHQEVFDF